MLNSLRSAADNIIFRLLLGLIVLAFVLWGVGDVIRGRNDFELVKFRKLPSIHLSEFYQAKKEAIAQLESNSKEALTDEMLEQMDLDRKILTTLIRKRMAEGWINTQGIVISDKLVADYIRKIPRFLDEDQKFNLQKFKHFLSGLKVNEEEFYDSFKFDLAHNLLQETVRRSVHTPKLFESIIINYLSQVKTIEYIKASLTEKGALNEFIPQEEEVSKFFEENKEIFKQAERRVVNFLIINKSMIKVADKASNDTKTQALMEEVKNLEDAVAGGETLREIAARYKAPVKSFTGTLGEFLSDKTLGGLAEQVFAMEEKEVAYPSELPEDKGFLLFEINAIQEGKIPPLTDIKQEVVKTLKQKAYVEANIKKLQEFESKATAENFTKLASNYGYPISTIAIERSGNNSAIPDEVAYTVLNTPLGTTSNLIILDDTAYIAKVIKTASDKRQAEIIKTSNLENISNYFKSSFLDEGIAYFYSRNIPDVRMELLGGN